MYHRLPLKLVACAVAAPTLLYALFVALLTIPYLQNQVIYLHSVTQTGPLDLNVPEQWGFLRNQVTPFHLRTPDGETLHAWHVLPLGLYQQHEARLVQEEPAASARAAPDVSQRLSFQLLRDDPEALLVLHFHGAGGTLGSGWRPPSYRAMSAAAPDKIHVVAIDYRGFGTSTGSPSEEGLLLDAQTLAAWAMNDAGIHPSRIVLFGQSLGTAVCISLAQTLAAAAAMTGEEDKKSPVLFAGIVLVAPFADVATLTATYRVAKTVPLLGPVAQFPGLLTWLNTYIQSKWPTKERLADFVRACQRIPGDGPKYDVTMIHAQDDYDIPWVHSDVLYWYGVNASSPSGMTLEELEREKVASRVELGTVVGLSLLAHRPASSGNRSPSTACMIGSCRILW
ncbi:alpha/beta-hydrolase [Apiospora phragmitis]|uniref:Alpha/beta-hydrolase n=1 Tax=Apiospora phragmitis TaxID=2905665 RepID=A0ABR1TW51_9PEZI